MAGFENMPAFPGMPGPMTTAAAPAPANLPGQKRPAGEGENHRTRKRRQYEMVEKAQVIRYYNEMKQKDPRYTYQQVVDYFQGIWPDKPISKSSVAEWCSKHNDTILREYDEALSQPDRAETLLKQKKLKDPAAPLLEAALVRWVRSKEDVARHQDTRTLSGGIMLNDDMIQQKAVELKSVDVNNVLKIPPSLNFSLGWVRRFRERNGIKAGTRAGDAAEAPALLANLAPISRDRLKQELQGYNLDDVYNAGEFATFYNIAPKRTLDTSRLSNAGGKKDRQRMSLLLLSNGNGSDSHLFAVGTTLIPSSFVTAPHTRDSPWNPRQNVGITWYKTPNGFMTESIFREVMGYLNREMKQQNRHIVVLLDHKCAQQFGAEAQFSNVKIVNLPANTSMPQCASMITSLKKLFRKHQIRHFTMCLESGVPMTVTCKDALTLFSRALRDMKKSTYANVFLNTEPAELGDESGASSGTRVDAETLEIAELMSQLHQRVVEENPGEDKGRELTMRDFITDLNELERADATLVSKTPQYTHELTTEELLKEFASELQSVPENDQDAGITARPVVTLTEARKAWATLSLFVEQKADAASADIPDALDKFYIQFCRSAISRKQRSKEQQHAEPAPHPTTTTLVQSHQGHLPMPPIGGGMHYAGIPQHPGARLGL